MFFGSGVELVESAVPALDSNCLLIHRGFTENGAACNPALVFLMSSHRNRAHYLRFALLSELS